MSHVQRARRVREHRADVEFRQPGARSRVLEVGLPFRINCREVKSASVASCGPTGRGGIGTGGGGSGAAEGDKPGETEDGLCSREE